LKRLDRSTAAAIREDKLRNNGRTNPEKEPLPPLFSKTFISVIARAVDEGRVAVRRVSYLLGLAIDELADLFKAHGVDAPYDL
jgi:XRE family transcriptional regulator, fatty acid utilization regulator